MGRSEAQQRQFVMLGRPGAFVVSFVGFGIASLFSESPALDRFLVVLSLALVTTQVPAWVAVARGASPARVAGGVLVVDIPMVAALTAALDNENLLVVAYFAPIAFAALMFGAAFTMLLTALAFVAVLVVAATFVETDAVTVLADLVVLSVTGGILAGLSREMHAAHRELAADRARDAAALHLAERVAFPQTLDDVLRPTVEELGRMTGATRCILRLRPRPDGSTPLYEWDREGVPPAAPAAPSPHIARVFDTGEPLVVGDASAADEELAEWAASMGARALVVWPIVWRNDTLAVLGFTDTRPRRWDEDAIPLLQRVAPLVGAALAQAAAWEEMQRVTHLREELVAQVSHELRTPLTSTIGFLRTLERGDLQLDKEEHQKFLAIARTEAERLAKLVDDLLELARLERGGVRLNLERVDLAAIAERATRGLDVPGGRSIAVRVDRGQVVEADPDRLLQILSNLLANAVRHGEGDVSLSSSANGRLVEIAVSDEGPGVPPDQIGELFQPFARGATGAGGTGLGLAIARALVEAHGGTLEYRSAENGKPHAFVVTLPSS